MMRINFFPKYHEEHLYSKGSRNLRENGSWLKCKVGGESLLPKGKDVKVEVIEPPMERKLQELVIKFMVEEERKDRNETVER